MEELKQELVKTLNESGLPLEAVYFVLKDVYRDVVETLEQYKKEEQKTKQEEQKQ